MADQAESVNLLSKESVTSVSQYTGSLRASLHEYFYLLVKADEASFPLNILLTILHYFQIYYFAFHPVIQNVWDTSRSETVTAIFGYPGIIHVYRGTSDQTYIVFFYFSMVIMIFFFFAFIYSFVSIARQRTPGALLINIQLIIANCLLTVLFIPFMDIFISMLNCTGTYTSSTASSSISNSSLSIYPSIECWNGMHIFYLSGSILSLIFLEFFTYLFSIFYFDGIQNDSKVNSVINARHLLAQHINSIVLVLTFNFMDTPKYNGVLNAIYFIGSLVLFFMIHTRMPFYHSIVQRYQSLFCTLHVWTSLMLALAQLTEKTVFQGLMYAWAIGIPLISFTVMWVPMERIRKDFTMNVNSYKFSSPEEVIEHSNYVQKLIKEDIKKGTTAHLLNGYIEFHNKTCLNAACPLKKVKFQSGNQLKKQQKNQQNTQAQQQQQQQQANNLFGQKKYDKRYQFCYEMISKLYEAAIASYPQEVSLRIAYSVFLMRIMKSKHHAINEVVEAENLKSSIDDKFTLYFIKRSIETEINEMNKESNGEYSEQRNLEGKILHFRTAMEQTVTLLMEFWSQFSDDKPDLIKLYDIGSKLFPIKLLVDEMWKKISRVKGEQIPKLLRIYSKYLIDIFNDKQQGMELLDRAGKLESSYHNKRDFQVNYASDLNVDGQEDGMIFMTMDEDRMGQIVTLNLSCSSMFGYSKTELLNKNVNFIMPYIYSKSHDDILKRYFETNEGTIINKDKLVFGKNKSGYIFPIILQIKPIYHALKDGMEFLALFRKEKCIKNVAYMIATSDTQIKDISSSCLNILGIDHKTISLQSVYLSSLIPDIMAEKELYLLKAGKQKDYTFPKINEDQVVFNKGNLTIKVNVWLQEINFKIKQNVGYILKIESIQKKPSNLQQNQLLYSVNPSAQKQQKSSKISLVSHNKPEGESLSKDALFYFKLVIEDLSASFEGEYIEGVVGDNPNNNNVNNSQINNNNSQIQSANIEKLVDTEGAIINLSAANTQNNVSLNQSHVVTIRNAPKYQLDINKISENAGEEVQQRNDYGQGIKTVRLKPGGLIIEIDRDQSEEDLSEQGKDSECNDYQKKEKGIKNVEDSHELTENKSNFMKEVNQELSKQSESSTVTILKNFSIFVILSIITIAIIDFTFKNSKVNEQITNLRLSYQTANRLSSLDLIVAFTMEMLFLKEGIRIPQYRSDLNSPVSASTDYSYMQNKLGESIQFFEELTNIIQSEGSIPILYANVTFERADAIPQVFEVGYASQQIISKAHNILQLDLDEIKVDQTDVFFVLYNGLNDIMMQCVNHFFAAAQNAINTNDEITSLSDGILIAALILVALFGLILTVFLGRTIFAKQLILSVFLEIPEKTAKYLYQKCENFLASLGSGEEDEVHSDFELFGDDKEILEEGKASLFGKRRKKFKNADTGNFTFLFQMLAIAVVIEAYFLLNYFLGNIQLQVTKDILQEYNCTCTAHSFYSFFLNTEKMAIYQSGWPIANGPSITVVTDLLNIIYQTDSSLHEEHARNSDQHSNSANYLEEFGAIMFEDSCPLIVQYKGASLTECQEFSYGIVTQGMVAANIRFFQLLRYTFDKLGWIYSNKGNAYAFDYAMYDETWAPKSLSTNITRNNELNLLRTPDSYEMLAIQTQYQNITFNYLQEKFYYEFNVLFDSFKVQRVLFLVFFILILLIASIICWLPFLGNLNKEIWSTKCLLSFIPIDEVNKIKQISTFIKEYILESKI